MPAGQLVGSAAQDDSRCLHSARCKCIRPVSMASSSPCPGQPRSSPLPRRPTRTSLIMSNCSRSSSRFSAAVSRHRWLHSSDAPVRRGRRRPAEQRQPAWSTTTCAQPAAAKQGCQTQRCATRQGTISQTPAQAAHYHPDAFPPPNTGVVPAALTPPCTTATRPRGRCRW